MTQFLNTAHGESGGRLKLFWTIPIRWNGHLARSCLPPHGLEARATIRINTPALLLRTRPPGGEELEEVGDVDGAIAVQVRRTGGRAESPGSE